MTSYTKCEVLPSTHLTFNSYLQLHGECSITLYDTTTKRRSIHVPIGLPPINAMALNALVYRDHLYLLVHSHGVFRLFESADLIWFEEVNTPLPLNDHEPSSSPRRDGYDVREVTMRVVDDVCYLVVKSHIGVVTFYQLSKSLPFSIDVEIKTTTENSATTGQKVEWTKVPNMPSVRIISQNSEPEDKKAPHCATKAVDSSPILFRIITCCGSRLEGSPPSAMSRVRTRHDSLDDSVSRDLDSLLFPPSSKHMALFKVLQGIREEALQWKLLSVHNPVFVVWEGVEEIVNKVMADVRTYLMVSLRLRMYVQRLERALMGRKCVTFGSSLELGVEHLLNQTALTYSTSSDAWHEALSYHLISFSLQQIQELPLVWSEGVYLSQIDKVDGRSMILDAQAIEDALLPYKQPSLDIHTQDTIKSPINMVVPHEMSLLTRVNSLTSLCCNYLRVVGNDNEPLLTRSSMAVDALEACRQLIAQLPSGESHMGVHCDYKQCGSNICIDRVSTAATTHDYRSP